MQAVVIRAKDGIPYLPNTTNVKSGEEGAFHIAAHGGPWHLYEAIRTSIYHTEDPEEADFVYVYDYCLYMQWLGQVGNAEPLLNVTNEHLACDYSVVSSSRRCLLWTRRHGDFVQHWIYHAELRVGVLEEILACYAALPLVNVYCSHIPGMLLALQQW